MPTASGLQMLRQHFSGAQMERRTPEGVETFAITVHDADAPTGSGFWHWVAYNFPSHVSRVSKKERPAPANYPPA